jgi:KDO2-lipid IV(A) lauroyltransferase
MLYLLYKIGLFLIRNVNLRTGYALASFFGKLQYYISKRDREIVKENLRNALPGRGEKEISLLAKEVFVNFGKYLIDFFSFGRDEKDYLKNTVRCIGLENIDEALKSGKGCIIVTGHFGNWELAGCATASLGYKINGVVFSHLDPRINNLFLNQRKTAGMNAIPIGAARKGCEQALRRNECVAILGDRPFGDKGIEAEFFGKTAVVPRGAALFSIKDGSPIVLTFIYKEDTRKNIYKLVFEKPFLIERKGQLDKQLRDISQRFINKFEEYIRRYPSQWYMFNKVWKDEGR